MEKETLNEAFLHRALEGMVWQFAHRGIKDGKPILWTGGQSALEMAFEALEWDDPEIFEDNKSMDGITCDVENCVEWSASQGIGWEETGYWCLCSEHFSYARQGGAQPKMKQRAVTRESGRDPITQQLQVKK